MPRQRQRRRKTTPPRQSLSMSSITATVLLGCICAIAWGIVCGIILFASGKLPPLIAAIASGIQALILFLVALFGGVGRAGQNLLQRVWEHAQRPLGILLGIGIASCIAVAIGFFGQSGENTTTEVLRNAPSAPLATLTAGKWHPLVKQAAPDCKNPSGTAWFVHSDGTFLRCDGAYSLMQRTSPQYYADMELVQVNNSTYNQTTFRVQVQVTFQNPSDTQTAAAILVQTPAQVNAVGGYLLVLNSTGNWQLQDVITGTNIPVVARGMVSINPNKPVLMTVVVKAGLLVGYINDQVVVWYNDDLNPSPGQVGLEVQGPAPSSPIFYSNFELDI